MSCFLPAQSENKSRQGGDATADTSPPLPLADCQCGAPVRSKTFGHFIDQVYFVEVVFPAVLKTGTYGDVMQNVTISKLVYLIEDRRCVDMDLSDVV